MALLPLVADPTASPRSPADAELKAAADACRLLGATFVVLGGAPLLPRGFISFWGPVGNDGFGLTGVGRLLGIVATAVLVGPGVWYFVAAKLIRRADAKAARASLFVAVGQAVLMVAGLVALGTLGRVTILSVPSLLGLFLLPALVATCVRLVRARRAAEANPLAAAFETMPPRAVLPISAAEGKRSAKASVPFTRAGTIERPAEHEHSCGSGPWRCTESHEADGDDSDSPT